MFKQIIVVKPHGFCAGVTRAVQTVEDTLHLFGKPLYVRHAIVHNQHVVERLEKKGVIFIDELSKVPDKATVIFSAHGVPPSVRREAKKKNLKVIDATCPLVTKVHQEAQRFDKDSLPIVLIGHKGHPEVAGTMGEADMVLIETPEEVERLEFSTDQPLAVLTQTTLSLEETKATLEALENKYPKLIKPPQQDICYATTNRQTAIKKLAKKVDLVFVIGDPSSSNSVRLVETARAAGVKAELVPDPDKADLIELTKESEIVGVSSGASAPEDLVEKMIGLLEGISPQAKVEYFEALEEKMFFGPPREIIQARKEK
ncbi:4-hydroxy-3-methylbut-2-enyl diphosphate reductase [Patescibacteria group bacterium]